MSTSTRHDYLSCAETAKLLRAALKKAFPTTKFKVRSNTYSGGASIDVRWWDGPTKDEVNAIAQGFAGGDFDGMIDLKYHHEHWLNPDGTTTLARTYGHSYTNPVHQETPPMEGSVRVHFGADFIFCERSYSPEFKSLIEKMVHHKYGVPLMEDGTLDYTHFDSTIRRGAREYFNIEASKTKGADFTPPKKPPTTELQDKFAAALHDILKNTADHSGIFMTRKGKTWVIEYTAKTKFSYNRYRYRVTTDYVYKDFLTQDGRWKKATMGRIYCSVRERNLEKIKGMRP